MEQEIEIIGNRPSGGERNRVIGQGGVHPVLSATDYKQPISVGVPIKIPIREAVKSGYREARVGGEDSINLTAVRSHTRRGRIGKGVAQTLDTGCNQGILVKVDDDLTVYAVWYEKYQCYIAIRKLTPLECFRLQSFSDEQFYKAQFVNSDSQLYRQAGNAVTCNVVEVIGRKLKER